MTRAILATGLISVMVGSLSALLAPASAVAATGINQTLNFQGRLLTSGGAVVADGIYNLQFKIYQDGTGATAGDPGGALKWTEEWLRNNSQGVTLKNGYFSVALGTVNPFGNSIDWNQDTLWLSANIGNTNATCTPFSSCSGDGEMVPMRRLSSVAYALNAATCTSCILQAPTSTAQNTITPSTNSVIGLTVNATSGTAATGLVVAQSQGADAVNVNVTGSSQTNGILVNRSGAGTLTNGLNITNTSGTLTTGVAFTGTIGADINRSSGILTLQGTGGVTITAGTTTTLALDSAGAGTVNVGHTNATTLNIGNTTATTAVSINGGTGSGAISIQPAASGTVTIGNLLGSSTTTVQGGTGNLNLSTSSSIASVIVKDSTANTTAFQVQNASSVDVLTVDTLNSLVVARGINSVAVPGSNLLADLSTCSGTNWALSGGNTVATHTPGSSTVLTCTSPAVVSGNIYQITFTTSMTASSVSPVIGGATGRANAISTIAETQLITAVSTGSLSFSPSTSASDVVISAVTVKIVTASNSVLTVRNSDATTGLEVRSGGSGKSNTFVGVQAGQSNATGQLNTAFGYQALQNNTTGLRNLALGYQALQSNTTGNRNTALGLGVLTVNTTGSDNIGLGDVALVSNTTGYQNTGLGEAALELNTTGYNNVALGYLSAQVISTGHDNVALGPNALRNNDTGSNNLAVGSNAGGTDVNNSAWANPSNLSNAANIGYNAILQVSNALALGSQGTGTNAVNVSIGTTSPTNLLSVSPDQYDTGTAGTGGSPSTTITGVGTSWTAAMVGSEFLFSDGTKRTITALASTTSLTVSSSVTEAAGRSYRIHLPALQVTSAGNVGINVVAPTATLQLQGRADQVQAIIQGNSIQTKDLLQIQDTTGASLLRADSSANIEGVGYYDTPWGGFGPYGNLINCSEYFDTTACTGTDWTPSNLTVTADDAGSNPAPDGQTTADKLVATAANGNISMATATAKTNNNYIFSVWIKSNSGTVPFVLRIDGTTSGTGSANSFTATTTWQRFSITQNPNAFTGNLKPVIVIINNGNTLAAWGAQMVVGSSPFVYVHTGSSTIAASQGLSVNDQASFQNSVDSTSAFQILSAAGVPLFSLDTTNSTVYIGNSTADATGALLVLDTKNTSGDPPTGINGGMYYNSSSGRFRCYEGSAWRNCITEPVTSRYHSAGTFGTGQSIPTNTYTALQFDTSDSTDAPVTATSTNSVFTINTAGTWAISASIRFHSAATGIEEILSIGDNTNSVSYGRMSTYPQGTDWGTLAASTTIKLAANAVIRIWADQDSASAITLDTIANGTTISLTYLGN